MYKKMYPSARCQFLSDKCLISPFVIDMNTTAVSVISVRHSPFFCAKSRSGTPLYLPFLYLKNVEGIYTTQKPWLLTNNHAAWLLAFRRVARFLHFAMSTRILLLRIPQCATDQRITLRTTTQSWILENWHTPLPSLPALQCHQLMQAQLSVVAQC